MAAPTLLQLEDALVARLETQLSPAGPLRVVEVETGQLIDAVMNNRLDGPSVFIHIAQDETEVLSTSTLRSEVQIQVFVAVMNYRGRAAARRGEGSQVGAMELLELIKTLLGNTDLGIEIQQLQPQGWIAILPPELRKASSNTRPKGPVSAYRYDWLARWTWPRPATDEESAAVEHTNTTINIDHQVDGDVDLESDLTHPEE